MPPELHTAFVARALPRLADDPRILAVAAGGSWGTPAMDEYSDIDLIVAVDPAQLAVVVRDAADLGHLDKRLGNPEARRST